MITETAPAKINLFLHVGPVRRDGLHALESLFVFADAGDRISVEDADTLSLEIDGPFAAALAPFPVRSNLVWRAAEMLAAALGREPRAAIRLTKNLPVAAGVGGGSADAAAALRALTRLWGGSLSAAQLNRLAFRLGADVPACLDGAPVYVSGAGEHVAAGPRMGPLWVCLVNTGALMPTGPVFRAFDRAHPSPPAPTPARRALLATPGAVAAYVGQTCNNLEQFAILRESTIGGALEYLAGCAGVLAARMSGSGATVFGLFSSQTAAQRAANGARAKGWWSIAARVKGRGAPQSGISVQDE